MSRRFAQIRNLGLAAAASFLPAGCGLSGGDRVADASETTNPVVLVDCVGTRRFDVGAAEPGARPYQGVRPLTEQWQFIIDLNTGMSCSPAYCPYQGPYPVDGLTADEIVFWRSAEGEAVVRRRTGYWEDRLRYGGRVRIDQGHCTFIPNAGFPPLLPRLIPMHEVEGTGPHPFIEYE